MMNAPLDISGMLHTCGHKLICTGIDTGCYVLVCLNKKCNEFSYRIPVEDPRKLISPCQMITPPKLQKIFKCLDCGD